MWEVGYHKLMMASKHCEWSTPVESYYNSTLLKAAASAISKPLQIRTDSHFMTKSIPVPNEELGILLVPSTFPHNSKTWLSGSAETKL